MFHNEFADWYRLANLTFTSEGLKQRSQGIEQIAKALENSGVLDIVRLSRGEYVSPPVLEPIIDAFAQFDSTFPRRNNEVEVQVLAGAIIVCLLEGTPSPQSDIAALASVTSDFFSLRRRTILPDFLQMSQKYLGAEGDRVRVLKEVDGIPSVPPKTINQKEINAAKEALTQGFGAASVNALVDALLSETAQQRTVTSEFLGSVIKVNKTLKANQKILEEESNILWWILGETSRDFDLPVSTLSLPAATIIIAKELADLTILQPGPVSAKHLLNRMLSVGRKKLDKTSLHDAANLAHRNWREKWRENELANTSAPILDLCPAMFAVTKSLETDGEGDWLPIYEKAMGKSVNEKLPAMDLAFQVYLECLLVSHFRSH